MDPVLLAADVRLLWAMTSDANKTQIRDVADVFVGRAVRALEDIIGSDTFREKHQRRFDAIVRNAFEAASSDPAVQDALDDIPLVQRMMNRELATKYLFIAAKNGARWLGGLVGDLSRMVGAQADQDGPRGKPIRVFDAPESRRLIAERIRKVVRPEELTRLTGSFARAFLASASRNPELIAMLEEIASDLAFAEPIAAIEQAGIELARTITRLLVGIDRDDRMHPLAATILRGLLLDNPRRLVAFVTPDRLRMLQEDLAGGVVALEAR